MSTVYRIEIDIRIDNRTRTKVIQTAREDYRKSPFAWSMDDDKLVEISAEEFVVDTKTAFLELAESAFRLSVARHRAGRIQLWDCGAGTQNEGARRRTPEPKFEKMPGSIRVLELPENPITAVTARAERRPVTSEVAGSSPVVPAIPFQCFPHLFKSLPRSAARPLATSFDSNRHNGSGANLTDLQGDRPDPAGRRIPAGRGSAAGWSVGRQWRRGRRGQRETFSPVSVPGQKRSGVWLSRSPFGGHFRVSPHHGRRLSFSARHELMILPRGRVASVSR